MAGYVTWRKQATLSTRQCYFTVLSFAWEITVVFVKLNETKPRVACHWNRTEFLRVMWLKEENVTRQGYSCSPLCNWKPAAKGSFSLVTRVSHAVVMPRVGLFVNSSESLLRINKIPAASRIWAEKQLSQSPVCLWPYFLFCKKQGLEPVM